MWDYNYGSYKKCEVWVRLIYITRTTLYTSLTGPDLSRRATFITGGSLWLRIQTTRRTRPRLDSISLRPSGVSEEQFISYHIASLRRRPFRISSFDATFLSRILIFLSPWFLISFRTTVFSRVFPHYVASIPCSLLFYLCAAELVNVRLPACRYPAMSLVSIVY